MPLNPLSSGDGSTLFVELDANAIGLGNFRNDYSGPHVWTERWREYINGTIGVGLALGDVDGDRLPDLFLVSKDEESRLYRNLGNCQFEDITGASGIVDAEDPASGAAFADVDNDGDLDLYLCFVAGKNQLWINDGAGRFEERARQWGVDISSGCTMASFADFDRDGDLDFYLQNNLLHFGEHFTVLEDQLFENTGDRFQEVTRKAGINGKGQGHSAVWWDFDEDGWPDIYVANDFDDLDKLYRNNGDGTFTDMLSEVSPQAPYFSMGADFGDINNDGHSDFWVADMATTTRETHMRTVGNNLFAYQVGAPGETHQYLKNVLLLKLANNHFAEIAFQAGLARTDWTWAVRLVDLNNDGWLDAYASNGMLRSFHDTDIIGKTGQSSVANIMADIFFNEPVLAERNLVYENLRNLQFSPRHQEWGLDKLGVSFGVVFGDLDLDGDLDLVCNNFNEPVSVFRNNETSGNRVTLGLGGVESNRFGIGAQVRLESGDLVQTRELANMRGYMSTDPPVLHFGLGSRDHIDRITITWPSGNRQVLRDLAVNRHYEISEENTALKGSDSGSSTIFVPSSVSLPNETIRKEAYFSDFKRQSLLPFRESRLGGQVVAGDVDQDGLPDLVISGATGQSTLLLINKGDLSFSAIPSLDLDEDFGSEDWDLQLVDWDGDGDLDLLAASGGVENSESDPFFEDRIYLNEGGDLFREWETGLSDRLHSSSTLAPADIDGDGDLDLLIGGRTVPHKYPFSAPTVLWQNHNGTLVDVTESLAPDLQRIGRVTAATWSDINGDGELDLCLAREWATPAVLYGNEGKWALDESRLITTEYAGLWNCLAVKDLDKDGRVDFVVGNLGLNSPYEASPETPIRLWHPTHSEGRVNLIDTYIEGGFEWTREVMLRLDKVFPRELRRVRTFTDYSTMTFNELFPNIENRGYTFQEAKELRSGIFWQTEDGGFTFEPLPTFAQSGRAMALLVEDVDGDGELDILVSLELKSPTPWSGRFEKGHLGLFLNSGKRGFRTVLPWESGLSVNGSPRGMVMEDLNQDGLAELLVVLNEGMPVVFSKDQ